jgi:5'-3' exoribonuclease 2
VKTDYKKILQKYSEFWDSNVITPGTVFMEKISAVIELYIKVRLNTNHNFKNLKCIFSDSSIPGEGEHKILEFLRQQRARENYNPNTKHCIYGADADLLFLGLSTHEPHFYIFRELIISPE